jgi:hypothetical protein
MGAQAYSSRDAIPLESVSLLLRHRARKARKLGLPVPPSRTINSSYPYFAACLCAASIHPGENSTTYFWGLCFLIAWALWSFRSPRYSYALWGASLAVAVTLGYFGQGGLSRLRTYLETLNPQWLSAFTRRGFDPTQSRTEIGHIGRIKTSGKIVIRLQTAPGEHAPPVLREASYRTYKGQTWYAGTAKSDFEGINHEAINETTWVLVPNKTNPAKVNIGCYLERGQALLPLPEGCGRLENLGAYVLKKNIAGAVLADGPGLVMFDALYGPGSTIDSPPDAPDDLLIPAREDSALSSVLSNLNLEGRSRAEVLETLHSFFQKQFTYSLWQERPRSAQTNETALGRFLLHTRSGHCEYFATATVLLLRKLNIPARYAIGYAVHEESGRNKYVVRQRDAHAWCLVWNPALRDWEDFDTTPGSWMEIEKEQASPWQFLSDGWSWMGFQISKLRWGQSNVRQYVLWGLVPVLGLLLYQIIFRSKRRRQRQKLAGSDGALVWPGLDSEFYQLEKALAARGVRRETGEPLSIWVTRATTELREMERPLQQLVNLHYRYRFDPKGLTQEERAALRDGADACLTQVKASARKKTHAPNSNFPKKA